MSRNEIKLPSKYCPSHTAIKLANNLPYFVGKFFPKQLSLLGIYKDYCVTPTFHCQNK